MAAQQIVTDSMRAHADILVGQALTWVRGRDKRTGRAFVQFESSRRTKEGEPIIYRADASACTCKGFLFRGICCHVVAVSAVETRATARASKPRKSYADLYPTCRQCGDITEDGTLCGDCCAAEVRRLDAARRRELVAAGR